MTRKVHGNPYVQSLQVITCEGDYVHRDATSELLNRSFIFTFSKHALLGQVYGPIFNILNIYLPVGPPFRNRFKQQLGCRLDIMDSISSFVCILTYAIIYVFIHPIIFGFIVTS